MRLLFIAVLLAGCAAPERDLSESMFAPQRVTGWKDADGKIHLKGVGGEQGYAVVTGK